MCPPATRLRAARAGPSTSGRQRSPRARRSHPRDPRRVNGRLRRACRRRDGIAPAEREPQHPRDVIAIRLLVVSVDAHEPAREPCAAQAGVEVVEVEGLRQIEDLLVGGQGGSNPGRARPVRPGHEHGRGPGRRDGGSAGRGSESPRLGRRPPAGAIDRLPTPHDLDSLFSRGPCVPGERLGGVPVTKEATPRSGFALKRLRGGDRGSARSRRSPCVTRAGNEPAAHAGRAARKRSGCAASGDGRTWD